MALPLGQALRSAGRYVVKNPLSMLTLARHAVGLKIAIPLDAIRWVVENTPPSKKAPTDVSISALPPAIGVGATMELMGSKLRASAAIKVDQLEATDDQLLLHLRLSNVELRSLDKTETPISGLIKSGALDVSKPGNLVNFMPKKPAIMVEAHDDVIVLDLMKIPKLGNNVTLRKVMQKLTPVMSVSALKTEGDYLLVALRPTPSGLPRILGAG